jgi:hypothetical protein
MRRVLETMYPDAPVPGEPTVARFIHDLFENGGSPLGHGHRRINFYNNVVKYAEKVRLQWSRSFPYSLSTRVFKGTTETIPERPVGQESPLKILANAKG